MEHVGHTIRTLHAHSVFRQNIHRSVSTGSITISTIIDPSHLQNKYLIYGTEILFTAKFWNELGISSTIMVDLELGRDPRTVELQHAVRPFSDTRNSSQFRSTFRPDIGSYVVRILQRSLRKRFLFILYFYLDFIDRHPGVSLRAWCLALQTLTLASNEPLPSDHLDPSISTPLDGLLGGMASCVVKDRNMGPMFLRLLSGNGLNVEPRDKQYMMVSFCENLIHENLSLFFSVSILFIF